MSARESLRDRIAAARQARFIDLPVPGVDGLAVRYAPVTAETVERSRKRHQRKDDAALRTSIDVLVAGCLGVFEDVDGKGVSVVEDPAFDGLIDPGTRVLTGALPTFSDPELGEAVGAQEQTAAATVLALYGTDWDVISAADKVLLRSGLGDDDEATRGN